MVDPPPPRPAPSSQRPPAPEPIPQVPSEPPLAPAAQTETVEPSAPQVTPARDVSNASNARDVGNVGNVRASHLNANTAALRPLDNGARRASEDNTPTEVRPTRATGSTDIPASNGGRGNGVSNVTRPVDSRVPVSSANNITNLMEDEEGLPKYKRDLVAKMKVLRSELSSLQPQSGHCRLELSRQEVFEDSYRQVVKMRPKDMKKRLMVKFKGEEGLDYGGVAREWLYLLSHEMLNPYYGLFQYSRDDIYTLQINADSSINPDHLSYFHFVGRIIGMALFHGHYIDGGFTMPFYKMLLNKSINLNDIESVDPNLHISLHWMLENDITDIIDTTFSVEHDSFGVIKVHELKKNGRKITVNESNKREYVKICLNLSTRENLNW